MCVSANFIDYSTGEIEITFPVFPVAPAAGYDMLIDGPSAVDRLAAIEDPDGEAGQRVKQWKELSELKKNMLKAQAEIYRRTRRSGKPIADQVVVHPKLMRDLLGETGPV